MATANKAWLTMVAAWTMLKSDRIIQDIDRLEVGYGEGGLVVSGVVAALGLLVALFWGVR